jgi:hypothetical protein
MDNFKSNNMFEVLLPGDKQEPRQSYAKIVKRSNEKSAEPDNLDSKKSSRQGDSDDGVRPERNEDKEFPSLPKVTADKSFDLPKVTADKSFDLPKVTADKSFDLPPPGRLVPSLTGLPRGKFLSKVSKRQPNLDYDDNDESESSVRPASPPPQFARGNLRLEEKIVQILKRPVVAPGQESKKEDPIVPKGPYQMIEGDTTFYFETLEQSLAMGDSSILLDNKSLEQRYVVVKAGLTYFYTFNQCREMLTSVRKPKLQSKRPSESPPKMQLPDQVAQPTESPEKVANITKKCDELQLSPASLAGSASLADLAGRGFIPVKGKREVKKNIMCSNETGQFGRCSDLDCWKNAGVKHRQKNRPTPCLHGDDCWYAQDYNKCNHGHYYEKLRDVEEQTRLKQSREDCPNVITYGKCVKYGCNFKHSVDHIKDCKYGANCIMGKRNADGLVGNVNGVNKDVTKHCSEFKHPTPDKMGISLPECQFGWKCWRSNCHHYHTHPRNWIGSCRYGNECINSECRFNHPPSQTSALSVWH